MSMPELPTDRRFAALSAQLDVLETFAESQTSLNNKEINSFFLALVDGMAAAGIDAYKGIIKGDYTRADQSITDSKGQVYKFDLLSKNLVTKNNEGEKVIDPAAVKQLKQMVTVAKVIAAKIFNKAHLEATAQAIGREFEEGFAKSGEQIEKAAKIVGAGLAVAVAIPVGALVAGAQLIEKQFQPLSKRLGDALEPLMQTLAAAANATGKGIKDAAATIHKGLQKMANQIIAAWKANVQPHLNTLYAHTLGPVLKALDTASKAVNEWGKLHVYPKLEKAYSKAGDAFEVACDSLLIAAAWIEATVPHAVTILFLEAPKSAYNSAKEKLQAAGQAIASISYSAYEKAGEKLQVAGTAIKEAFESLGAGAKTEAAKAYKKIEAALGKTKEAIVSFGKGTKAAWNRHVQPQLDKLGKALIEFDNALGGYVGATVRRAGAAIAAVGNAAYDLASLVRARTVGGNLTDNEKTKFIREIDDVLKLTQNVIDFTTEAHLETETDASKDPIYQLVRQKGFLGFWRGFEPRLRDLRELVENNRVYSQQLDTQFDAVLKDMIGFIPMARAIDFQKGVQHWEELSTAEDSLDEAAYLSPAARRLVTGIDVEAYRRPLEEGASAGPRRASTGSLVSMFLRSEGRAPGSVASGSSRGSRATSATSGSSRSSSGSASSRRPSVSSLLAGARSATEGGLGEAMSESSDLSEGTGEWSNFLTVGTPG